MGEEVGEYQGAYKAPSPHTQHHPRPPLTNTHVRARVLAYSRCTHRDAQTRRTQGCMRMVGAHAHVASSHMSDDLRQVTRGLIQKYGKERVVDTPITESGFTGTHILQILCCMQLFHYCLCGFVQALLSVLRTRALSPSWSS